MGVVKYTTDGTYHIGEALKEGWGREWEGERFLIGLKLQDRNDTKHTAMVFGSDWFMGILKVHFEDGNWLCLDHAIEQFECIGKEKRYLVKKGSKFMKGHGYSKMKGYRFNWTRDDKEARIMEYDTAVYLSQISGGKEVEYQ